MKVIQVGDESTDFEPKNEEESELLAMLFENLTKNFPDVPLADRAGAAMEQFVVFKRWAHKENLTTGMTDKQVMDAVEKQEEAHDRLFK